MSLLFSENGTHVEELEDTFHDDGISAITSYKSDTEKKVKKKKASKPMLPNSPYLVSAKLHPKKAQVWRSLKGTGQMHPENPMVKVPRQLWLASLKQGNSLTQPLKSDTDTGQAWVNPGSNTPEYLKEALGMKKPKYSRSSSTGYIPGTPDFKEREDMYDEILDLKKTLQTHKSDTDLMKTKLRKLEEENIRKDRQIEQLLDPSRNSEVARSLVEKRNDNTLLITSLKQKILKLEKHCKEKDSALSKLQTDLKSTNVEEMRVAMETYYEEIQRLQLLLTKTETHKKKTPGDNKECQKRQKAMNTTLHKLSKQVKELQEENKSLKADLDRVLAQSPTPLRAKGYNDWSKQRLVKKILELEKGSQDPRCVSEHLTGHAEGEKLELAEKPIPSTTEQQKSIQPGSAPNVAEVEEPTHRLQEECERLRNILKKVKEDRAALQERLATKESDIRKLQQEKMDVEEMVQRLKDKKDEREEMNRLSQKIKLLAAELEDEKREKETSLKAMKKAHIESSVSRSSSARSTNSVTSCRGSTGSSGGRERQRQQKAAQVIQRNWRQYKSREVNKSPKDDLDDETMYLQSAFRGHLARQEMLSSKMSSTPRVESPRANSPSHQDSAAAASKDLGKEEEDHATFLQSKFRAHLMRTKALGQRSSETEGRESPIRKSPRENTSSPVSSDHYFLDSDNSEEVMEDYAEEVMSEKENDGAYKRPPTRASSSKVQSEKARKPFEEVQSDDSDDVIVSPSRPAKRNDSDF